MIKSFRHKGLAELFETGKTAKIDVKMQKRIGIRMSALNDATETGDLQVPGYDFHPLQGKPQRYTIHVNGPWCITFEFENGEALRVDFEQYH